MKQRSVVYNVILIIALSCVALSACRSAPPAEELFWKDLETRTEGDTSIARLRLHRGSETWIEGPVEWKDDGSAILSVEKINWFSNWYNGWTEAEMAAGGKLAIQGEKGKWSVEAQEFLSPHYAQSAKIRYKDNFLSGTQAAELLDRRILRISRAAAFLHEKLEGKTFTRLAIDKKKYRHLGFYQAAGEVLFPEVYGYPAGTAKGNTFVRGEGIRWDVEYSSQQVPPELAEVRNSGTLYRDWEEMPELFYYIYTLEN